MGLTIVCTGRPTVMGPQCECLALDISAQENIYRQESSLHAYIAEYITIRNQSTLKFRVLAFRCMQLICDRLRTIWVVSAECTLIKLDQEKQNL